jgi:hypothetical protein
MPSATLKPPLNQLDRSGEEQRWGVKRVDAKNKNNEIKSMKL